MALIAHTFMYPTVVKTSSKRSKNTRLKAAPTKAGKTLSTYAVTLRLMASNLLRRISMKLKQFKEAIK